MGAPGPSPNPPMAARYWAAKRSVTASRHAVSVDSAHAPHIRPGNGPGDDCESGIILPRRSGLPRGDQRRRGVLREERMGGAPSTTRGSEGGTSKLLSSAETTRRSSCKGSISGSTWGRSRSADRTTGAALKSASLIMRVAVSKRPTLPGTRPRIASARRCSHPITSAPLRLIAGPNSAIGSAASHMRSKWTSNFAAAAWSRITIKSLSCARSPLVLKFADPSAASRRRPNRPSGA